MGPDLSLCCWHVRHSAVVLARSALGREAPKTSTPSEVISGFSRSRRLVSLDTGRQATCVVSKFQDPILVLINAVNFHLKNVGEFNVII